MFGLDLGPRGVFDGDRFERQRGVVFAENLFAMAARIHKLGVGSGRRDDSDGLGTSGTMFEMIKSRLKMSRSAFGGALLPILVVGAVVGPATAGEIEAAFEIDRYGVAADGTPTGTGSGDFVVIDLYATTNASSLKLLNVFDVQASLARGAFVHNDVTESGRWEALYTNDGLGATGAIDSFVTMGPAVDGDPYLALLDPNFDGSEAGSMSSNAGWYNPDPLNDQGLVSDVARIFLARFVIAEADVAGNAFTLSGSLGWKLDTPGSIVQQSSGVVSTSFAGEVVPGPVAASVLGALALLRRRRR